MGSWNPILQSKTENLGPHGTKPVVCTSGVSPQPQRAPGARHADSRGRLPFWKPSFCCSAGAAVPVLGVCGWSGPTSLLLLVGWAYGLRFLCSSFSWLGVTSLVGPAEYGGGALVVVWCLGRGRSGVQPASGSCPSAGKMILLSLCRHHTSST